MTLDIAYFCYFNDVQFVLLILSPIHFCSVYLDNTVSVFPFKFTYFLFTVNGEIVFDQ